MQIKTDLNDIDLESFSKNFNKVNNDLKISLIDLKYKLVNNYNLILIYNKSDSIIGSCLYRIEENIFNEINCEIFDIFSLDNNDSIIDDILNYLINLKSSNKFSKIIFQCPTNNKFLQKRLSKHKFIIKSYLFLYS